MIGWRQLGAFVQRYQRHKNLTAFMSPTRQEMAAWPTLHTKRSVTDAHFCNTHTLICPSSIELSLKSEIYNLTSILMLSICGSIVCVALLSKSDSAQQRDKAKTGGVTAPAASDQGADRTD